MSWQKSVAGILGVIGTTVAAITALWRNILGWARSSLIPWLEASLGPEYAQWAGKALAFVDSQVTPLRQAWSRIRERLLSWTMRLSVNSQSEWVRTMTTYVMKALENGQPQFVRRSEEQVIDWDVLPADVRARWLEFGRVATNEMDLRKARDTELKLAGSAS